MPRFFALRECAKQTPMKMNSKSTGSILFVTALACAAASLLVAGCKGSSGGDKPAVAATPPATPVVAAPVRLGSISEQVAVVGNLQTLYSVNLSPKTAGRLIAVNVREGDPVKVGQLLAEIDPTEAAATVRQDEANVQSYQAKVDQAIATYNQEKTTYSVGVKNAQASLASAQVTLQKTIVGDQPQQKLQAQYQLNQQQANYNNALNNLNEQKQLYSQGAIAKSDMDNAQAQYDTQNAQLQYYQQNLSLVQQGGRPEDIEAARQVVVQDQENLRSAQAATGTVDVDEQAITGAKADLAQQYAMLAAAKQALADCSILSPINGVVSQRSADPGTIAQPGTTVLQVVDLSTMYYEPTVSETDFRNIDVGQAVDINVDAFPGRDFYGKVTDIFPAASTTDRQFSIRVSIPNSTKELRPGMYARGMITTVRHTNVIIVSTAVLLPATTQAGFEANTSSNGVATGGAALPPQQVFIVGPNNKAVAVPVGIGIINGSEAEVTSGLKLGDKIIVKGQGELQDGDTIKVTNAGNKHHAGGSGAGASDASAPATSS